MAGRCDVGFRKAGEQDQRTTYLWTFSHTELPGRKSPRDFTRESFASAVAQVYEAEGKSISQWACFREKHANSPSGQEQRQHFHLVVETDKACRWRQIASGLRSQGIYASVSTVPVRNSYWLAFKYCYLPSAKKPKDDLDADFVVSPGHEEPPFHLQQVRLGIRRLSPTEVYEAIVTHGLDAPLKFLGFAHRLCGARMVPLAGHACFESFCSSKRLQSVPKKAWPASGGPAGLR